MIKKIISLLTIGALSLNLVAANLVGEVTATADKGAAVLGTTEEVAQLTSPIATAGKEAAVLGTAEEAEEVAPDESDSDNESGSDENLAAKIRNLSSKKFLLGGSVLTAAAVVFYFLKNTDETDADEEVVEGNE